MDAANLIAAIAIIVGLLTTYHVAWKAGIFRDPKLKLAVGLDDAAWLAAVGPPIRNVYLYVTMFTCAITNMSTAHINQLAVIMHCHTDWDFRPSEITFDDRFIKSLSCIASFVDVLRMSIEVPAG